MSFIRNLASEFGLCLSDTRPETLITPRALNYFHNTGDTLVWSERTHRGAALVSHDWSQWSVTSGDHGLRLRSSTGVRSQLWRASCSMSLSWARTGILVSGSELGRVVCSVGKDHS